MKKLDFTKKGLAALLIAVVTMTMTGCGSGEGLSIGGSNSGDSSTGTNGPRDVKEIKNLVYSSEKLEALDQMKGDVSSYYVAGDNIYVYTTEWIETPGSMARETEETEETETVTDGEETEAAEDTDAGETEDTDADTQDTDAEEETEHIDEYDGDEEETEHIDEYDGDEEETEYIDEYEGVESSMYQYFYSVKTDGSDFKEIPLEAEDRESEWLNYFCVSEDGVFYILYNCFDQETETYTYLIRVFDQTGKQQNEFDVTFLFDGQDGYFQSMKLDKDGNICLMTDQSVYVLDAEGKSLYNLTTDNYIMGMALTSEGNIIVAQSTDNGSNVQVVDSEKKAFGDTYEVSIRAYGVSSLISAYGSEGYSFYYSDDSSIFGYDIKSGKSTELLNWVSSNINTSYVGEVQALSDGRFITNYVDYSSEGEENGLYVFTKVDPSDVPDKTIITYTGLYVDDRIKAQAVKFNKSQEQYQIVVSDYSMSEDPFTAMNADLLAGEVPDIMDLSGLSSDKYIAKGMLEDLYTYMDKDEDISRDEFIENIIQTMETDGKLYHISPVFGVNTLIGRTSDIGGKEKFTIQDLVALEASKGGDAKAFYMRSNTSVLSLFCSSNYNDYIDWNTGECSFDGEEFIQLLEYANGYENDDDMQWSEDMESMPTQVRNGKVLLVDTYSMSIEELELYNKMFESEISFIGCPSSKTTGIAMNMGMDIGIYSKSKNKDGAWEFLKTFLTEEYISANLYSYYSGFPLRKDCLENEIKKYTATEMYTDKFGNEIYPFSSSWGYDDFEVELTPISEEEVQQLRTLIASVDHMYVYNDEIMTIITEEAGAYFSGQKSSKEVADIIQNRISTYVNENR